MKENFYVYARRNGALCAAEKYRECHKIVSKFTKTEGLLFFFFCWYPYSKFGRIINNIDQRIHQYRFGNTDTVL